MLHKLLLVLLPLFSFVSTDDNFIDWSKERKLTWSDFKGQPDSSSPNAALTNSNIKVDFGYNNKGLTHTIKCRFNKSLSWGRIKNDYILNHEQGHFNIAEIHARMLHKDLQEYNFNSKTVNKDINNIYDAVVKKHVSAQQQYDLQTNHSLDSAKQRQWDVRIGTLLKEYEAFSDYH